MRMITLRDDTDRAYDTHWVIPASMETDTAVKVVDEAVRKIKEDMPGEFTFGDLESALLALGFSYPQCTVANETW